MILVYRVFTTLIYPLLLVYILIRKLKKKEDRDRYKEKIFTSYFNIKRKKNSKLIWFHAASIGEFKSIVPIIRELNLENNDYEFLITTTTLSSSNLAKEELTNFHNAYHRFFPFDVNFLIKNFLLSWKPDMIFLVDSEIWPNLMVEAKKLHIPLTLINARLTIKTFKRWMMFPGTAKTIFGLFDLCLSSNLETKKFLEQLGAKRILYVGNLKLINNIDFENIKNLNEDILINNRFWLAASTHRGEERLCLETHLKLKQKYNKIITIIAPRHIERVHEIKDLCNSLNLKVQILNKEDRFLENKEIIIINSFGILQNYFKFAKSVFIGKSTIKKLEYDGGQNPIDAAKLGCKVYHGPYIYNFQEIYEILKKNNISTEIKDSFELSNNIIEDLKIQYKEDDKISNVINNLGQKTLADTMKSIKDILHNEVK